MVFERLAESDILDELSGSNTDEDEQPLGVAVVQHAPTEPPSHDAVVTEPEVEHGF